MFEYFPKILKEGDSYLRYGGVTFTGYSQPYPSQAWNFQNPQEDINKLSIKMVNTMRKAGGIGLSANQVGLPYSLFVMGFGQYTNIVINPEIVDAHGCSEMKEGCLSSPGLFLKIARPSTIQVKYSTPSGESKEETLNGITSRVFQHEYDHLRGVYFTDHAMKGEIYFARKKVKKLLEKDAKMIRKLHGDFGMIQTPEEIQKIVDAGDNLIINI